MVPGEELAVIGSIKAEVVVLGHKFVLQTLDSDAEVITKSATMPFGGKAAERVEKIEKLARAIVTIDNVPFSLTDDEKESKLNEVGKARKLIYKWCDPVVARVYAELEKLEEKREEAVAALEKNAPTPTTSTGSIK